MNKIFSFLKQNNRYRKLVGGFVIGICALSPWTAVYSAAVAASCLELKNDSWNWIDWLITVIGGICASIVWIHA